MTNLPPTPDIPDFTTPTHVWGAGITSEQFEWLLLTITRIRSTWYFLGMCGHGHPTEESCQRCAGDLALGRALTRLLHEYLWDLRELHSDFIAAAERERGSDSP